MHKTTLYQRQLSRERRSRGCCGRCGLPVGFNPRTGRRPYYCDECDKTRRASHQMAAVTWRDRRKARGECVQCGHAVTTKNPKTGLPTARCTGCARLQSDVQKKIRARQQMAALGIAS